LVRNSPVESAGVDCHELAIPVSKLSEKYGLADCQVVVVVEVDVVVLVVGVVVAVAVVVGLVEVVVLVVVDVAAEMIAVGFDVATDEPFLLLAVMDTRKVVPASFALRSCV
jgi:hypothetical protein